MLHIPADADTRWNIDNIENSNGDKFVLITDNVQNVKELCSKEDFDKSMETSTPLSNPLEIKDVPGFYNLFMVSEKGDLLSKRTNKILSQTTNKNGYLQHATKVGGREGVNVVIKTHRAVANTFIPNPENKPAVNHINGIKKDNSKNNLEWVTFAENTQHAFDTGLVSIKTGVMNKNSAFDSDDIDKINEMSKEYSQREIAKAFNVRHGTVGRVLRGERYVENISS